MDSIVEIAQSFRQAEAGIVEVVSTQRANAADKHVGARIRERRTMLGLSQQQLAKMIGVTCRHTW